MPILVEETVFFVSVGSQNTCWIRPAFWFIWLSKWLRKFQAVQLSSLLIKKTINSIILYLPQFSFHFIVRCSYVPILLVGHGHHGTPKIHGPIPGPNLHIPRLPIGWLRPGTRLRPCPGSRRLPWRLLHTGTRKNHGIMGNPPQSRPTGPPYRASRAVSIGRERTRGNLHH
jgi:hypothetical protein